MNPEGNEFEQAGRAHVQVGLVGEYLSFLRHNKKWWLLPILALMLLLGLLMLFSGSAAAPFIYTLF
jgi:hypothetical protein